MYVAANDNTDNAHNEPRYVSNLLPFAHEREMQCNRDEGFEIELRVSARDLKGTATVEALTIAVMMSIFSDIPLD